MQYFNVNNSNLKLEFYVWMRSKNPALLLISTAVHYVILASITSRVFKKLV